MLLAHGTCTLFFYSQGPEHLRRHHHHHDVSGNLLNFVDPLPGEMVWNTRRLHLTKWLGLELAWQTLIPNQCSLSFQVPRRSSDNVGSSSGLRCLEGAGQRPSDCCHLLGYHRGQHSLCRCSALCPRRDPERASQRRLLLSPGAGKC